MMEMSIYSRYGRTKSREVVLKVGNIYVIEPLNSRKMKNRGRQVEILRFREGGKVPDAVAVVKYLDTGRQGVISELDDLAPLPASEQYPTFSCF